MYKKLYLTGLVVYAVLLILAVLFYMERIAFSDAAFAVFHLVKDGNLGIQVYRFGDALSKLLPLAAYHMNMSLSAISICYSVGFIAVYLTCYIVCGTLLRNYGMALVLLLVNILFVAHSFYWPIPQEAQGIAILLVLLALLWNKSADTIRMPTIIIVAALLITIVFFHPLMIIATAYIACYFALNNYKGISKNAVLGICGGYALILLVKLLFFRTVYERQSLSGLKNFVKLFPSYFDTYANRTFLARMVTEYYWIPLVFLLVLVHYLKAKNYKLAIFFIVAVIGYTGLINTTYPNSGTPAFYMEALYLPLGLFLGLPLVLDVLPAVKKQYAFAFVVLIMLTGSYRIYTTHEPYTKRLNWERRFLEKNGNQKMIVNSNQTDIATLQMIWGTPYEFWLLSTIEYGYSASIIIDDTPSKRSWATDKTTDLVVNWNSFPYAELDKRYFRLNDTLTGYIINPELKE